MDLSRSFITAILLSCGPLPLAAREISLLQFDADSSVEHSSKRDIGNAEDRAMVYSRLLEHFAETRGQNADVDDRHTWSPSHLPVPQITEPSSEESSHLARNQSCDGTAYTPAWWLPQDTERRRAAYFGTVARIACEHGLPTRLLDAVIAQESGYNFGAISSAGAMGMMQIMPGTARALGLSNPFDPIANMRAGALYLRQQLDRFGRVDLALAAYNAGPERRSLRAGYIPAIPETRNYVRTITTNWARLAQLNFGPTDSEIRGNAAITAVHTSGYRSVEQVRYDGLNAANPM
ncbi:lytic transglycosylase domain-containing protein [Sphingobium xenophagum]